MKVVLPAEPCAVSNNGLAQEGQSVSASMVFEVSKHYKIQKIKKKNMINPRPLSKFQASVCLYTNIEFRYPQG